MTATDDLVANARHHADRFQGAGTPTAPARKVAVVACMDARLDVFALLGLATGDAHVIRNAGGVVTDDVLRSLVISQRLLGTEEIVLVHHTDCGMTGFTDEELQAAVEADTGVRPPFAFGAFADVDESVRRSVVRLRESPFVAGDRVRGFVYDVDTGALREVS